MRQGDPTFKRGSVSGMSTVIELLENDLTMNGREHYLLPGVFGQSEGQTCSSLPAWKSRSRNPSQKNTTTAVDGRWKPRVSLDGSTITSVIADKLTCSRQSAIGASL
jgi:hypothetical protein